MAAGHGANRRRPQAPLILVAGLLVSALACTDETDEPDEPTATEVLDACELPQPCGTRISWDGCAYDNDRPYDANDVCTFTALLGDEPAVVRASTSGSLCGDVMPRTSLDLYRWADGTMTCAITQHSGGGPFSPASSSAVARNCSLPDTATIEACLASAIAGEEATQACLDFDMWGLQLGDEIEASCGP